MTDTKSVLEQINKAFGPGTMKLGSDVGPVRHWQTGILPVDMVLDGGPPQGRFTEFYGDYSTMKSYVGLSAVASVQKAGGRVAYVDTEKAFDSEWAQSFGIDTDDLLVMNTGADGGALVGEEALAVMEVLIRDGYDLIIWDSIATSQPRQYAEKKPGEDLQPGGQARMMSAGLRRLNSVNRTTAILAINQTRVNVGMTYGSTKDSMPGGKAMPFYASYRVRLTKAGRESEDIEIWDGEKKIKAKQQTKQKIKVTLEKWKLNAPVREVWMDFDLHGGFVDETSFIIGWGIEQGYIVAGAGGLYQMEGVSVRGRDKFIEHMSNDKETLTWMREEMTKGWLLACPGRQDEPPRSKAASMKLNK